MDFNQQARAVRESLAGQCILGNHELTVYDLTVQAVDAAERGLTIEAVTALAKAIAKLDEYVKSTAGGTTQGSRY